MNNPERKLMISVLTTAIQDYINLKPPANEKARIYIFRNDEQSDNDVFGFNFICRFIDIDPEKFRNRIEEIKKRKIPLASLRRM